MKGNSEYLRLVARGYGGMLLIASIGIAVLLFGGIVTNAREAERYRSAIRALEEHRQQQQFALPVLGRIAALRHEFGAYTLPDPGNHTLTSIEISGLHDGIAAITRETGLEMTASDFRVEYDHHGASILRADLRMIGSFTGLRETILRLIAWKYRFEIEAFSIESIGPAEEIRLIIRLPLA